MAWKQSKNICFKYCKFRNFREGLFLGNFGIAEFCENKTLVKGEITMSIIDVGKSCPS